MELAETEIKLQEFTLNLPGNDWTDHSTSENYEFRVGERKQLILALHMTKKHLSPSELEAAVFELVRIRLDAIQKHSGNSCTFESPQVEQTSNRFSAFVFGRDPRGVLMQLRIFGTPQKLLVASYYNYSDSQNVDAFKQQANAIISNIRLK